MNFHQASANCFIPDSESLPGALSRTTHLAIGAHQDDLEFFAFHGIGHCHGKKDAWFSGITCTDGASSSRTGAYADVSDSEMKVIRAEEQRKAATIGKYATMIQLGYPSAEIKDSNNKHVVEDLTSILSIAQPEVVYLHNPADKHDTHIAVLLRSLQAIRNLPVEKRPKKAWGCEIWRGLDWLIDQDKGLLPTTERPDLQASLNSVFESQIMGGKRYDLAVMGRRLANATFLDSHHSDTETGFTFAMDLTPLIQNDHLDIIDYTLGFAERLKTDIELRLKKFR